MVVQIGGSVGNHTFTHHSNHADSEFAKDTFVQHQCHSQTIPFEYAAASKASTALFEPMLRVHPKSIMTYKGLFLRLIVDSVLESNVD